MLKRTYLFFFAVLSIFFLTCSPHRNFNAVKHPSVPDYSSENSWIALPWRKDIADTIPPGCTILENQKNALADVFYIHPTVLLSGSNWNGDINDKTLNKRCDRCVLIQGTAFNAAGKIYAPRYRQAHLYAFGSKDTLSGRRALDLAYSDVKAAFEYYLKNWNKGRPIIIAGHSQGARHAARLLADFFDGKELQKQLVAAYPVGMPIPKNYFKNIPLADSASQTACWVTWNTFVWGSPLNGVVKEKYGNSACVNPLTWLQNDKHADASLNMGGVPAGFKRVDKGIADAKIYETILWIHPNLNVGYYHMGRSYHPSDISLFYMNIRKNAIDRVNAYIKKH